MQNIYHIEPRRNYNALWRVALLLFFISSFCQHAVAQMSIFGTNCVTPGQTYTYSVSSSYVSANSQTYWELSGGVIAGTGSSIETRPGISSISVIWNDGGGVKTVNMHIYGSSNLSASLSIGTMAPLSPGSLTSNVSQTVAYKNTPATITCSAASGGGCPPVIENYQWQQSTDQSLWTDIPGVIDQDLSFYSPIFATTYFRRKVTSNSYQVGYSNVAVVNAVPLLKGGIATPAAQYILTGATPAALSVSTVGLGGGCNGSYTYQWFSSSDGINYSLISGATGTSYMPGSLTQTSYYRLKISCGSESLNSTTATVYVNPPGIGSADQNFILTSIPRDAGITNPADPANTRVIQTVQYSDDLGRTMQTVLVKGSPLGKDIVQPVAYDNFGRESTKYLPYALTSGVSDGSYKGSALTQDQATFYNSPQAGGIPVTPNPYAVTVFEPSPQNRVIEQGAPGQDWQPTAGHTLKVAYTTNDQTSTFSTTPGNSNLGSRIAALYQVSSINAADQSRTLILNGTYGPGQLYVTISKNENWNAATDGCTNTTEEYTDNLGHVVLKRTYNLNTITNKIEELSTYYVYDDLGNLAFVLPPVSGADNALPAQTTLDNLCYQYRYDEQNRLTQKRVPGQGWVYIVYNQLDQPVLTQDANQRVSNQWSVTKYDVFGRVIMTGLWNAGAVYALSTLQNNIYAVTQWDSRDQTNNTTSYPSGYILGSYPIITKTLTINYYDDYRNIPGLPAGYQVTSGVSAMTQGLLTASKIAVLNTITSSSPDYLWTAQYYDDNGRNIKTFQQHYLGGTISAYNYDEINSIYSFNDQVTATTRKHNVKNLANTAAVLAVTVANQYDYDNMSRKTNTWEQITNGTNTPDPDAKILLSKTGYNELGQVSQKGLHGGLNSGPAAQGTDITLGSTDALTSGQQKTVIASRSIILNPGFGAASGSTFIAQISSAPMQTINYTYNERGWLMSSSAPLFAEALQYNTTITQNGVTPTPQYNGNIAMQSWGTAGTLNKTTGYVYDQLNRLTTGNATTGNNENSISYDLMGNITALKRYTVNNTLIDQLTYTYTAGTNKLQNVNDAVAGTVGQKGGVTNYTYDDNGNLLSDDSKGITGISYNLLNLPQTITGKNTSYVYDATGQKLRRVVGTAATDYIGGIQYDGATTGTPVLSFIQTQEGRALPNGSTTYNYEYSLTDHLGNRRVNFDTSTGTARLVQTDDYYPFGMDIPSGPRISPVNSRLYNGKELQENLGLLDYGFRFYDPVIARWNAADPMAENHYDINPYNYVLNNPVRYMDYLGLDTTYNSNDINNDNFKDKYKPGHDQIELPEVKVTDQGYPNGFGGFGLGGYGFGDYGYGGSGGFVMRSYLPPPTLSSSSGQFKQQSNRGNKKRMNWITPFGKINWVFGLGASSLENFSGITRVGSNFKLYKATARGGVFMGNQYVETFSLAKTGELLGRASFIAGVAADGVGIIYYINDPTNPNAVSPGKAGVDTGMGLLGLTGFGTLPAVFYFGIDAFYPGGIEAATKNATPVYNELNKPSTAPAQLWGMP